MAFVTKYTLKHTNSGTGNAWYAHIQEDGGSFTANLEPAEDPIAISYQPDSSDVNWCIASSVATIRFGDTDAGVLSAIFNGGTDDRYKLIITEDVAGETVKWAGFIDPESYSFGYMHSGIGQIQATDRIRKLSTVAYEVSAGVPYTGQERISTIIARCMAQTGIGIGIATHSNRYSYLAANPLSDTVGSSDDPLYYHTVDQRVYLDSAGNSLSCYDVLTDLCLAWNLQIFQSQMFTANRWCAFERRRSLKAVSPFSFDVNLYTTTGTAESQTSVNGKTEVSITGSTKLAFTADTIVSAEVPIGSAAYIYLHGPLGDLFTNLGFEDDLEGWTLGTGGWSNAYYVSNVETSTRSLSVPTGFSATPHTATNHKIDQSAVTAISTPGTGYRLRISFWALAPYLTDLPAETDFWFYWSFKVGGDYWQTSTGTWENALITTEQAILNPVAMHGQTGNSWHFFNYTTDVLDGRSGILKFQMREAVEEDTGGSATQFEFYIDEITIDLLDSTDQVVQLARETITAISGTSNLPDTTVQSLIGEGPFESFYGAIRQKDSTDTDIGLAENWSWGVEVSANGRTFDKHNAWERIVQYREPTRTVSGTITSTAVITSSNLTPSSHILIERPDSTTQDDYVWYRNMVWRPSNPRALMTATWIQVQELADPDIFSVTNISDLSDSSGIRNFTSVITLSGTGTLDVVADNTVLKAITVGDTTQATVLHSWTTSKDKGGGVFVQDSADSSTTTNDITVFAGTDNKRIKRAYTESPWPVQWAGALGDGTTDDSAKLQSIVDAAAGGAITLPRGRYVVDTTILLDGIALELIGQQASYYKDDGRTGFPTTPSGSVIIAGPSLTGPIFKIQDTVTTNEQFTPVTFRNIHFIGNGTTDTHAIHIVGGYNVQVHNCNITGFSNAGLLAESATFNPTSELTLVKNTFESNGFYGARLDVQASTIRDNIFDGNALGGCLEDLTSAANVFDGNYFTNNATTGLDALGLGLGTIVNNKAVSNGAAGIFVGQTSGFNTEHVIKGNTCRWNGTDSGQGNASRSGLVLWGLKNSTVSGNTLSGNEGYGMYVFDLKNTRLEGNSGSANLIDFMNTRTQTVTGRYNAIENGVLQAGNDASLKIQEMIDEAVEGSVIELPVGDYLIANTLTVNKVLTFQGQASREITGTKGTRLYTTGALQSNLFYVTAPGVIFDGVNLIGPGTGSFGSGVSFEATATSGEFRNGVIRDFNVWGILINGATNVRITDTTIADNGAQGIAILSGSDNSMVDRCTLTGNGFTGQGVAGISVTGSDNVTISRSVIANSGASGVQLQTGSHAIVSDCQIYLNAHQGVKIRSGDNHSVHGNAINANGFNIGETTVARAGVYIEEGNKHKVNNNYIGDNQTEATQLHAVTTGPLLSSATILGNTGTGNVTAFYNLDSATAGVLDIDIDHTETINLASMASGASVQHTVTITGARGGDKVKLGPPSNFDLDIIIGNGVVTADDTLKIPFHNPTLGAIDAASGDWKIGLERREGATASVPAPTGLTLLTHIEFANHNLLLDA